MWAPMATLMNIPQLPSGAFEDQFFAFMESKHSDILKTVRETGKLEADTEKALKDAIADFKKIFVAE